jgi:hypothetical protein
MAVLYELLAGRGGRPSGAGEAEPAREPQEPAAPADARASERVAMPRGRR